jgi:ubiquinone/menaquinone biosynthesis C-methylase UbiE
MKDNNSVNFNDYADDYRNIHDQNIKLTGADSDYFSKYKIQEIKKNEFINNFSAYKILDIGCGDGNSEIFLNEFFPSAKITGIDISEKSIK